MRAVSSGCADFIVFRLPVITIQDFVERLNNNIPFAANADQAVLYVDRAHGCIDFPTAQAFDGL